LAQLRLNSPEYREVGRVIRVASLRLHLDGPIAGFRAVLKSRASIIASR
jgi:hypothetical protein